MKAELVLCFFIGHIKLNKTEKISDRGQACDFAILNPQFPIDVA